MGGGKKEKEAFGVEASEKGGGGEKDTSLEGPIRHLEKEKGKKWQEGKGRLVSPFFPKKKKTTTNPIEEGKGKKKQVFGGGRFYFFQLQREGEKKRKKECTSSSILKEGMTGGRQGRSVNWEGRERPPLS